MAFCGKCGNSLDSNAKFCPSCGASTDPNASQSASQTASDFVGQVKNLNNTADTTSEYDPADIASNKGMAVLSYFSLLVLVPILGASKSKFARFHANQGLIVLIIGIVLSFVSWILGLIRIPQMFLYYISSSSLWWVSVLQFLLTLPTIALIILGVVNAATGRAKELPIVGKIRILK